VLQNAAHGEETRKGRRDWRKAARLGFFCGFSNRAGGDDLAARLKKGPRD